MRAIYFIAVALLIAFAAPAVAETASGDAEVRAALKQWMADFNAGRADKICGIFAPTLRADVDGFPERTFDVQCKVLQTVLADPEHSLNYALDIKEILADGDMAAVRLLWTLTSKKKSSGESKVTQEQGLDIFGRSSDGRWQIIRFMSFER
jgi:ketosteroid isomerase-like protein